MDPSLREAFLQARAKRQKQQQEREKKRDIERERKQQQERQERQKQEKKQRVEHAKQLQERAELNAIRNRNYAKIQQERENKKHNQQHQQAEQESQKLRLIYNTQETINEYCKLLRNSKNTTELAVYFGKIVDTLEKTHLASEDMQEFIESISRVVNRLTDTSISISSVQSKEQLEQTLLKLGELLNYPIDLHIEMDTSRDQDITEQVQQDLAKQDARDRIVAQTREIIDSAKSRNLLSGLDLATLISMEVPIVPIIQEFMALHIPIEDVE